MNVLWDRAPLDGREIAARLKRRKWSRTTVRTFLARLVQKGAVKQTKVPGKRVQFQPLIDRASYQHAESRSLIERVFGGKVSPLVTQLAATQDIAELKALLERIENDHG